MTADRTREASVRTVAVTGAYGYVGSACVQHLESFYLMLYFPLIVDSHIARRNKGNGSSGGNKFIQSLETMLIGFFQTGKRCNAGGKAFYPFVSFGHIFITC